MTEKICAEFRAEFKAIRQERRWIIIVLLILAGVNAYRLLT